MFILATINQIVSRCNGSGTIHYIGGLEQIMTGKLDGKAVLITGGNSGIGQATALLFAQEGAQVMIAARSSEKAQTTITQIEQGGGKAAFIPCDVRLPEDCERAVSLTVEQFGRIDVLFNNAGIVPFGTVLETSLEIWHDTWATNVSGTFYTSRAALPYMIAQGGGVIVNNGSDWAVVGGQQAAAYCASKGAIALLTKSMALDHARQGIRVNAVCPGDTYVERWDTRLTEGQSLDEFLGTLGKPIPMNRVGRVEEIARAVLFLASDDSSYMTGQLLVVDGGNTAGGVSAGFV
jgi:meso-butanediol dehydrogenase / (S,S)-butanediol dehydrogenase / diacetyl reductase